MRLKQKIVTFFITITVAVSFPLSYAKSPSCFEDVNPLHKYYSSIQKAYENNRVHGFGNGRFSPDSYLKNDEFIYLLKNYFSNKESSRELFREYALTNSREYFADCFSYWIRYGEDENKMQNFKEVLPETYEIFYQLYKNKWEHI